MSRHRARPLPPGAGAALPQPCRQGAGPCALRRAASPVRQPQPQAARGHARARPVEPSAASGLLPQGGSSGRRHPRALMEPRILADPWGHPPRLRSAIPERHGETGRGSGPRLRPRPALAAHRVAGRRESGARQRRGAPRWHPANRRGRSGADSSRDGWPPVSRLPDRQPVSRCSSGSHCRPPPRCWCWSSAPASKGRADRVRRAQWRRARARAPARSALRGRRSPH